jgi:hypothetical protein
MGGMFIGTISLQQFFSPPEAAELIAAVVGTRGAVLNPTAGNGALLSGWPAEWRFGVETDHAGAGDYEAIVGNSHTRCRRAVTFP